MLDHNTGSQLLFHQITVHLKERNTLAADILEDKAFPAKEAGGDFFREGDIDIDGILGAQEGPLLADQAAGGADIQRLDLASHSGSKGNESAGPLGSIGGHEQGFSCKHAADSLHKAAAGVGGHGDPVAHPCHASGLGKYALTFRIEHDLHSRHCVTYNTIFHMGPSFKNDT